MNKAETKKLAGELLFAYIANDNPEYFIEAYDPSFTTLDNTPFQTSDEVQEFVARYESAMQKEAKRIVDLLPTLAERLITSNK